MRIAVFGLGEAGSLIAADLAAAGADVRGFDPADVPTPPGVDRHPEPQTAVVDADLVMSITAAADAPAALTQALEAIPADAIYADLATATPALEEGLAEQAGAHDLQFADVALMSPVPGRGLRTPALASGPGAASYAATVGDLGGSVTVVGETAGIASARKLMRSIFIKGLTSVMIESLEVGAARGDLDWLRNHLFDEMNAIDRDYVIRLLVGTGPHARRRLEEMQAAADLIADAGHEPIMTRSTIERLRRVLEHGLPENLLP